MLHAQPQDNTTVTHDSIQTIDQQHIPVDKNITVENNINNKIANTTDNDVVQTVNNDTIHVIDNAVTVDNTVKVADNTANAQPTKNPKLDIKGPKTDANPFDGKTYFGAGKKVTLKLNGKTYTTKTNDKEQATFKLDITKKGTYTADVSYAGDNTYKSAKTTAKIKIN